MKKLSGIIMGIAVALLTACTPHTEYTNALPKDASVIMAFDVESMAGKAGLHGKEGDALTEKIIGLVRGGLEGDAGKLAEKVVKDPSESGLSLKDKVYFFATPHANAFGLLLKVDDEGNLEDIFEALQKEQLCTSVQEESGCRWTQLGSVLCTFNNGTFLMMKNRLGDVENIKGTAFMLMRQKEGEGFSAGTELTELKQQGSDIVSVVDLSVLPDRITTPLRMGLSGDIRLQDVKYLVDANFEPGRVVVEARSLTTNSKIKGFYKEMDQVTSVVQGKYLEYYPANTFAWTGGRIQGKSFYDMVSGNPTLRQELLNPELPIDMERIFSSIEGDYAMAYTSLLTEDFLIYADVTHSSFLETFEELRPLLALTGGQIQLFDTAENQYALKTMEGIYWFGVKGNLLYITNRRNLAEEAGRRYGVSLQNLPWAGEVSKNRMYASVNFSKLQSDIKINPYLLSPLGDQQAIAVVKTLIGACETMNVCMPDWSCGRMELVLKDKKKNALQLAVQIIEQI